MAKTVVGLFKSIDQAQSIKSELVNTGYAAEDISVVANEGGQVRTAGAAKSTAGSSETGVGEKISSFFRSLTGGDPEEENYYTERVRKGGALLAITVPDDRADETAGILESYGAKEVDEQTATPARTTARADRKPQDQTAIPVVEEELKVGKHQVQRGGVRVYSHVTERPAEANVQLREEHIRVERRPVDRPATEADFNTARDQAIELTETAEEAVVGKTSRVVEEVLVGKETTERSQTIKDTVRKTEVEVEKVGASGSARSFADYEPEFRKDFQANYAKSGATYERYVPAYKYGYTLAADPRYTQRDWATIESQARTDWTREGKGSWEEFKAAIRSGWDRVRGR